MIYLLTGQPGSGKTSIAKKIIELSKQEWFLIDGDDVRELFDNIDYSKLGRENNISLSYNIARYLMSNKRNVIISLVSPYKLLRDELKSKYDDVLEIYVHTSEIRGREHHFVEGYESPTENFIDICTDNKTIEESAYEIIINKMNTKWE